MSWQFYARLRPTGNPKAQPRVKAARFGAHARVYTPPTADNWKLAVMSEAAPLAGRAIPGPLKVTMQFFLARPKARHGEYFVSTKPDIDNLIKSTLDALTDQAVWRDDAVVVSIEASKEYEDESRPVGAVIEIYTWGVDA